MECVQFRFVWCLGPVFMAFFPLRLGLKVTDLYGSVLSLRRIKKAALFIIRVSAPLFKRTCFQETCWK